MASRGCSEIRLPQRVDIRKVTEPPQIAVGRSGLHAQRPAQLGEQEISLREVVALAGRHHIGPFVRAAPAPRNDVIDGVRRLGAIDTHTAIPAQDRAARHGRRAGPAWNPHHVGQAHD